MGVYVQSVKVHLYKVSVKTKPVTSSEVEGSWCPDSSQHTTHCSRGQDLRNCDCSRGQRFDVLCVGCTLTLLCLVHVGVCSGAVHVYVVHCLSGRRMLCVTCSCRFSFLGDERSAGTH